MIQNTNMYYLHTTLKSLYYPCNIFILIEMSYFLEYL